MILSFINQKGGVGKTTLTLVIALAISHAGHKVCIYDLDGQGTATNIIKSWQKCKITDIELVSSPHQAAGTFVIIDTPPVLNDVTKRAVELSTSSFVVSSPSPFDLISSQATIAFMKKHVSHDANINILFNGIVGNTRLAHEIDSVVKTLGVPALKNSLMRSINYQHIALEAQNALNAEQILNASRIVIEIITLSKNHA